MKRITKYIYLGLAMLGAAALVSAIIASAILLVYEFIIVL